jgi:[ribosomal protein S18]-alanine N-acetyltransferase
MDLTKIRTISAEYLLCFKKSLLEYAGICLLRKWEQTEKENIITVDDSMLPEILRIQAEGFIKHNSKKILRYSKDFRVIFYVIKSQDQIAGYCIYYLRPVISFKGLEKEARITEIAIDKSFRDKGLAKDLLKKSIQEMKLNGIKSILLYVDINNESAIRLYKKIGFQITKEIKDICGRNEMCLEMRLRLV